MVNDKKRETELALVFSKLIEQIDSFGLSSMRRNKQFVYRGENKTFSSLSSGLYREFTNKESATVHEDIWDKVQAQYGDELNCAEIIEADIVELTRLHSQETLHTDDNDILAELQHFGAKTNFIDFSLNWLIAVFFACNGNKALDGRVIIMKSYRHGRDQSYSIIKPKILSSGRNQRIISQNSIVVKPNKGLIHENDYCTVTIEANQKEKLLKELKQYHGITWHSLFNDIPAIAKSISEMLPIPHYFKGSAKLLEKDYVEAFSHFDKAIDNSPQLQKKYLDEDIEFDGAIFDREYHHGSDIDETDLGWKQRKKKSIHNEIRRSILMMSIRGRGVANYFLGKYKEAIDDLEECLQHYHYLHLSKFDIRQKRLSQVVISILHCKCYVSQTKRDYKDAFTLLKTAVQLLNEVLRSPSITIAEDDSYTFKSGIIPLSSLEMITDLMIEMNPFPIKWQDNKSDVILFFKSSYIVCRKELLDSFDDYAKKNDNQFLHDLSLRLSKLPLETP